MLYVVMIWSKGKGNQENQKKVSKGSFPVFKRQVHLYMQQNSTARAQPNDNSSNDLKLQASVFNIEKKLALWSMLIHSAIFYYIITVVGIKSDSELYQGRCLISITHNTRSSLPLKCNNKVNIVWVKQAGYEYIFC